MITTIRGTTAEEVAKSANMVFRELEQDLRPNIVTSLPASAEGAGDVGQIGEQRIMLQTVGAEKRVRYFERLKGPSGDAQWREFPHREIGGPLVIHNQLVVEQDDDTTGDGILFRTSTNNASETQYAGVFVRNYYASSAPVGLIEAYYGINTPPKVYVGGCDDSGSGSPSEIHLRIKTDTGTVVDRIVVDSWEGVGIGGIQQPETTLHIYDSSTGDMTVLDGAPVTIEQASTGDAAIQFQLTGGTRYAIGIDNSVAADPLCIYKGTDLCATISVTVARFAGRITAAGDLTVEGGDIGPLLDLDLIQMVPDIVTVNGDLRVDGGDIGLTTDTDLIQIALNSVTVNGTFSATTITGMAPSNATYIVQTANATLTNEQVLSVLTTGLVKNTTTTGVLSIGVADTDYQQPVMWGDGLGYSAPTASVDYNATNLKITTAQIDTIQGISSAASPTFAGMSLSDGNLTNVGQIDLDLIRADAANGSVTVELDDAAGADFIVGNNSALVVEGDTDRVGIGTATPSTLNSVKLDVFGLTAAAGAGIWHDVQLLVTDDRAYTTGVGGGIGFSGRYQAADQAVYAAVRAAKPNAVSGDPTGNLELYCRDGSILFLTTMNQNIGSNTERMRLDSTGRLGVNTVPSAQLHVDQSSTTAAIPVLTVDQADVSEEFIRFIGTSANAVLTQSIVEAADVASFTVAGYLKIYVSDDGNQIADGPFYIAFGTLA